jgi:AcrR family transcriptional regulator
MVPKKGVSSQLSKTDKWISVIAEAAAECFSSKGYVETSMDDVAEGAGISKGGVYYYFSSKGDLLFFVLSSFMDLVLQDVSQELEKIDDPVEKIRFIVFRHVRIYTDHIYSAKTLINQAYNLPSDKLNEIRNKEREYFNVIAGVISSYLGPRVDKDTLTVIAFNLLGMCNWIYAWYNPKGSIDRERLSRLIFENFVKGASAFRLD